MNTNELRIGNYIDTGTFHLPRYRGIYIMEASWFKFADKFKPIPLTEQWLLDFGYFTIKVGKLIDATLPNFRFSLHKSGNYDGFLFCENDNVITSIESVHQLQNLYFALTGIELIKKI